MPEAKKEKAPTSVEEARAALTIVQYEGDFYIVCRNPFQEPRLYRIQFDENLTYGMFLAYQESLKSNK